LGEAFALEGLNEDKDFEVAPWLNRVCRRLIEATGAGVTLIDHGTKSTERPLDPSGSKRKRAAATGTWWLMRTDDPFDRAGGGRAALVCAKDRHGWFKRGETVARLVMSPVDLTGRSTLELEPVPVAVATTSDPVTSKKVDVLRVGGEAKKPLTRAAWLARVGGRATVTRAAFDELVEDGQIVRVDGTDRLPTFALVGVVPVSGVGTTQGRDSGQSHFGPGPVAQGRLLPAETTRPGQVPGQAASQGVPTLGGVTK
jgi:hypothetical protein